MPREETGTFLDELPEELLERYEEQSERMVVGYTDLKTGDKLILNGEKDIYAETARGRNLVLENGEKAYSLKRRDVVDIDGIKIQNLRRRKRGARNYIRIIAPEDRSEWERIRPTS